MGAQRVSRGGGFQYQGGSPLRQVWEQTLALQFRGGDYVSQTKHQRLRGILRLDNAPRPTVLLVSENLELVYEGEGGALKTQALNCRRLNPWDAQWLDARAGQPGPNWSAEEVTDLDADTRLRGGQWLLLGYDCVLDVASLRLYALGEAPRTPLARIGTEARAVSPSKEALVWAASGPDPSDSDRTLSGLIVADIQRGQQHVVRFERKRFRFQKEAEINAAWLAYHFDWRRDSTGRETLIAKERLSPWPLQAELVRESNYHHILIDDLDGAALPLVAEHLTQQPTAARVNAGGQTSTEFVFEFQGCRLKLKNDGGGPYERRRIALTRAEIIAGEPEVLRCNAAIVAIYTPLNNFVKAGKIDRYFVLD